MSRFVDFRVGSVFGIGTVSRIRLKTIVFECRCGREYERSRRALVNGWGGSARGLFRPLGMCGECIPVDSYRSIAAIWNGIVDRCYNKQNAAYVYYGRRGIGVCSTWRSNKYEFIWWCYHNGWKSGLCIDRKENDKGYKPSNTRFVTYLVNNSNRRNTVRIEYNGKFWSLKELASFYGFSRATLFSRLFELGWSTANAIETPINRRGY